MKKGKSFFSAGAAASRFLYTQKRRLRKVLLRKNAKNTVRIDADRIDNVLKLHRFFLQ